MAPAAMVAHPHREEDDAVDLGGLSLLEMASAEIERIRVSSSTEGACRNSSLNNNATALCKTNPAKNRLHFQSFPPACLAMLKCLDGNHRCVDCGEHDPQWAAIKYGALLCLQCSGHHRSLGVHVSCVRSISMDEWSLEQVLCMLEGGNGQLTGFFKRHALTLDTCPNTAGESHIHRDNVTRLRYKTKAALFYRQQLELHVQNVLEAGPYRGRDISRRLRHHRLEHRNTTLE